VNYYYKVEPKLDLSAGFRYRDNILGRGGIDSRDLFYNVGARGEFTPNLTGEFNIGYQQARLDNGTNFGGLGLDSKFTFAVDPKNSIILGITDDFSYAATGNAYRGPGVSLGFNSAISDQWSVNGQAAYTNYDYITSTQKDDFYNVRIGVTYTITAYLTASASYTYAEDNSNVTGDSFKDNIFSVSASLHY